MLSRQACGSAVVQQWWCEIYLRWGRGTCGRNTGAPTSSPIQRSCLLVSKVTMRMSNTKLRRMLENRAGARAPSLSTENGQAGVATRRLASSLPAHPPPTLLPPAAAASLPPRNPFCSCSRNRYTQPSFAHIIRSIKFSKNFAHVLNYFCPK